jgi:hypothetical protein
MTEAYQWNQSSGTTSGAAPLSYFVQVFLPTDDP